MNQPTRVLIVKTSSMGDVIHTLPALTDAANAIPGIRFDWVVEEGFAEIPTWHPAVDKVIPVAIRRWRKSLLQTWKSGEWKQFKRIIGAQKYDAIIDAQGLLKSALLLRYAQGLRYGLDKDSAREPMASRLYQFPQKVECNQHAVERVRQLFAKSLGYTVPETPGQFLLNKEQFPSQIVQQKPYAVFLHGTTWATKHWPENYWCSLAQKVNQAGLHVVLPWGSEKERIRAELIASSCANATVLPKLKLAEVAGVICEAKAAVAVDTGLGHLTAALETPAVSLYGPTSPVKVGAYGTGQKHLTLEQCPAGEFPATEPEIFAPMTPEVVWRAFEPLIETH
ncbi:lipopolysaccharide heptosyltransferase I [Endozoicomonas ascidiicola]|uniref:lipopolysaccharide heptosyltransferase I n=1 Tax=Endozoicomonas ascidiicola TaxID=1698521 RepID=UPI000834970D|nr:lipopolysaccharide heptosyltransferase I [Endozoicomonas ascidiicola]